MQSLKNVHPVLLKTTNYIHNAPESLMFCRKEPVEKNKVITGLVFLGRHRVPLQSNWSGLGLMLKSNTITQVRRGNSPINYRKVNKDDHFQYLLC